MKDNKNILKGYKQSQLGLIPEDWDCVQLKTTGKIGTGSTPETENKSYWLDGDVPWLPTGKVNDGIIVDCETFITRKALEEKSIELLPAGSLLIAMVGQGQTRGKVALLKIRAWVNQNFAYLIPNPNVDSQFLYFVLKNSYDRIRYEGNRGGNQGSLNGQIVKSLRVILPLREEQTTIANLLSTWDKAINTLTQLIAQKELRKKWLMQQLLTGKKRLKGFEKMKWEKMGAGEIFKNVSIKGNSNEQLLSATQDKGMIPREMLEARVTMPKGETDSFKLVEKGDFVISLRSFQGGLEYSEYRGLVSPAYTVLKSQKKIVKDFYRYYFKSYDFIGHLAVAVIGIRDGKQISYDDFCFINIPYPSTDEQKAISVVLEKADEELGLLQIKRDRLKDQKKGLMQILLTGKKRLRPK